MKQKMVERCACCGELSLPADRDYAICPVCGWEDDEVQQDDPDFDGGANDMSLNQAKEAYRQGKPIS